jgi:hypothetical protein
VEPACIESRGGRDRSGPPYALSTPGLIAKAQEVTISTMRSAHLRAFIVQPTWVLHKRLDGPFDDRGVRTHERDGVCVQPLLPKGAGLALEGGAGDGGAELLGLRGAQLSAGGKD